jgi:hypothetical protein
MRYQLTVRGDLSPRLERYLEAIEARRSGGATTLTVDIRDQADLLGLVDRVSGLGLDLVAMTSMEDGGSRDPVED